MLCMLFKGLFNQGKKSCRCQKNLRNYLNCNDCEMLNYKRVGKWVYRIYTYTCVSYKLYESSKNYLIQFLYSKKLSSEIYFTIHSCSDRDILYERFYVFYS